VVSGKYFDPRAGIDHQFTLTLIITGIIFVLASWGSDILSGNIATGETVAGLSIHMVTINWKWPGRRRSHIIHRAKPHGLSCLGENVFHWLGAGCVAHRGFWANSSLLFSYPGSDGKFGPTHVEKVDDALETFSASTVTATLIQRTTSSPRPWVFPVNRPVELILRAKDVSHSFFVRELRVQQDMVPGMEYPFTSPLPRKPSKTTAASINRL